MPESLVQAKIETMMEDGQILYQQLISLIGMVFDNRYQLTDLLDVGGQGVLYIAEDSQSPHTPILMKIPLREYHRSAYLTAEKINASRLGLQWEAHILDRFAGTIFPEFYDYFLQINPLHDTWWNTTVEAEDPFLVLEFIQGQTLDDLIGSWHQVQQRDFHTLEDTARNISTDILSLFENLWTAKPGFLYTDLRPQNIMIASVTDRRGKENWQRRRHRDPEKLNRFAPCRIDTVVRLIDAGSVVPTNPWKDRGWPHHLAYVPPEYYSLYEKGDALPWPNPDFVLYTLGKTMWQFLAGKEPVPGQDPEFDQAIWGSYSDEMVGGIKALIELRNQSFDEVRKNNPLGFKNTVTR